jgi:hypothetical protein
LEVLAVVAAIVVEVLVKKEHPQAQDLSVDFGHFQVQIDLTLVNFKILAQDQEF